MEYKEMAQEPTKFLRELYSQRNYEPAYKSLRPPHSPANTYQLEAIWENPLQTGDWILFTEVLLL